jgi:osmotically inducible protein OsmC
MALSFGLAKAGHQEGSLLTEARVKLEAEGEGFKVSRSDLRLKASVPGIAEDELRRLAEEAKTNCPISKALNVEMTLEVEVG